MQLLYQHYLPEGIDSSQSVFATGLKWACKPLPSIRISLVRGALGAAGYEPYDLAVEVVSTEWATLSGEALAEIIGVAEPLDCFEMAGKAFDADELFRSGPGSEGGMHCEVRIGDSMLMVGGGGAGMKWRGTPMPSAFHIYVPDCDATYARALAAGGVSVHEPVDQPYGERSGTVKDAAGNSWYIATYKGKNYRWEGAPTLQPYLHPLLPGEQRDDQLLSRDSPDVRIKRSPRKRNRPNARRSSTRQADWPWGADCLRTVDRRFVLAI